LAALPIKSPIRPTFWAGGDSGHKWLVAAFSFSKKTSKRRRARAASSRLPAERGIVAPHRRASVVDREDDESNIVRYVAILES
jgi:hypothetical protein